MSLYDIMFLYSRRKIVTISIEQNQRNIIKETVDANSAGRNDWKVFRECKCLLLQQKTTVAGVAI